MNDREKPTRGVDYLSPLMLTVLMANAVCFGAALVLLLTRKQGGPVVLLAIATGMQVFAGGTGAIRASRRRKPDDGN